MDGAHLCVNVVNSTTPIAQPKGRFKTPDYVSTRRGWGVP